MKQDFFHECEIKYRLNTLGERETLEQQVKSLGFTLEGRQLETDFLPDTENFLCRQHGILLRFRRIIAENNKDILLTLKVKGTSAQFQEYFELEYKFSNIKSHTLKHINAVLKDTTGKILPYSIHEHDAAHFTQLVQQVKTIFPAHRILLEKKRTTYTKTDCHVLFDTLPEGIGDYLEIEAPSPEKLTAIVKDLDLNTSHIEPLDYGDILKRHKQNYPDQLARTGLFSKES